MSGRGRPTRAALYRQLDQAILELDSRLGGLPAPFEAEDIWEGIWFEEAHHSTAIEGNTLVLKQVEQLLAEGRAVGNKQLSEYLEVRGYADAARWVYRQGLQIRPAASGAARLRSPTLDPRDWQAARLLSVSELRELHRMALDPVWEVKPHPQATPRERPGGFREHDVLPFPEGMVPPSWVQVPNLVSDWIDQVNGVREREGRLLEHLAELHNGFERIHPFLDGNGRTGRLALNLVLVRLGYPPAIIYKSQRSRYLAALRRADAGEVGALGELIARAVLTNLYRFVVPAVAGPQRLVHLRALVTKELSENALRAAATRSRLKASKGPDGQWRSTKRWVSEYARNRHKRQPV